MGSFICMGPKPSHTKYDALGLLRVNPLVTGSRNIFWNRSLRPSHDANEKSGRIDFTLFELKGSGWVRTDFPLIQRSYEEREVRERLRKAGFDEPQSSDGNELVEGPIGRGRMFFVARKRDAH